MYPKPSCGINHALSYVITGHYLLYNVLSI